MVLWLASCPKPCTEGEAVRNRFAAAWKGEAAIANDCISASVFSVTVSNMIVQASKT